MERPKKTNVVIFFYLNFLKIERQLLISVLNSTYYVFCLFIGCGMKSPSKESRI